IWLAQNPLPFSRPPGRSATALASGISGRASRSSQVGSVRVASTPTTSAFASAQKKPRIAPAEGSRLFAVSSARPLASVRDRIAGQAATQVPAGPAQEGLHCRGGDFQPAADLAVIELLELLQDDGEALALGETLQGRVDLGPALLAEKALLGRAPRAACVSLPSKGGGFPQVGGTCHPPAPSPAITQGIQPHPPRDAEEPRREAGA